MTTNGNPNLLSQLEADLYVLWSPSVTPEYLTFPVSTHASEVSIFKDEKLGPTVMPVFWIRMNDIKQLEKFLSVIFEASNKTAIFRHALNQDIFPGLAVIPIMYHLIKPVNKFTSSMVSALQKMDQNKIGWACYSMGINLSFSSKKYRVIKSAQKYLIEITDFSVIPPNKG